MSITKSYNKQTGIYYAYETTYEWSDEKQKKVQRKRCIGQFDPQTGEVIPNGKVGRPSLADKKDFKKSRPHPDVGMADTKPYDLAKLIARLEELDAKARILSDDIHELLAEVNAVSNPKS